MLKKIKSKKVIIVSIMIMLTSVLMLSYASFVVTTNDYKASELLVSELTYQITIYDENNNQIENPIRVSDNTTKIYNVVVRSINKIDSKYTLAYNSQDNVSVKYSNRTSWSTEDYIKDYNSNNTKNVRIVVENKSNETRNVEIKIFGGYRYNDYIKIDTKGYTRITEEYDEELLASSEVLSDIIKEETKCEREPCLYGGGNKSNYLSYSNNLYRIIGTYNINNERVTKIISESITPSTNIKEDLTTIYNSLKDKEEIIYKTNKFNCNETGCTDPTDYNNIGLLTKYEYETIGGENSYLNSSEGYYITNGTNIETQNGSETGGLKPVLYLPSTTKVTGSGTINDPYIIKNKFIVTYNSNGGETLNPESKEVTHLKTYGDLPTPTRTGYTFNGWYTEINGGSQITKDTKVTNNNDHTIYARWTINSYNVTVYVNNGYATSTNPLSINYGGSGTITIAVNSGYKLDGATVSCDSGGSYNQAGTVTFSNVTSARSCTITLVQSKVTFTMSSGSCVDKVNDNSGACYIVYHGVRYSDWDKIATYGGKTYTNCTIDSYNIFVTDGISNDRKGTCTEEVLPESYGYRLFKFDTQIVHGSWYSVSKNSNNSYASCKVSLTCDPA